MKQILIIEDDKDIGEALRDLLEGEGLEALVSANGQEAIDYLRSVSQMPKVILLDMMMPVKNGAEFRAEQLADSRLSQIPVIIMTAKQDLDLSKLGAAGVIRKPVPVPTLLNMIKNIIDS